MNGEVRVFADADELSRAAAEEFTRRSTEAVGAKGSFTVALSGGSTPKKLYALLADKNAPYHSRIPWDKIQFFFGDERHVPPDHAESNYRMAHNALLAHVPVPEANVHRMLTENPNAVQVAEEYERRLRRVLRVDDREMPRFDLVLLGLGTDGHTASLFPGTTAVRETSRAVVSNRVEKLNAQRLTLTFPAINAAHAVIFLVTGADKADALRSVLDKDEQDASNGTDEPLPASLVHPQSGNLLWLTDKAAAKQLTKLAAFSVEDL